MREQTVQYINWVALYVNITFTTMQRSHSRSDFLHCSSWRSCPHHTSSCWSAALRPKKLALKPPGTSTAAHLLSSQWEQSRVNDVKPSCHHPRTECGPVSCALTIVVSTFSGSHIENWHSILRKGLVNASKTKFEVRMCLFFSQIAHNWWKIFPDSDSNSGRRYSDRIFINLWILIRM